MHSSTQIIAPGRELATAINAAHEAAIGAARSALQHARRAGELLIEAKAGVEHGAWLPWLSEHCPNIGVRQAQKYMKLAEGWPAIEAAANTNPSSHLTINEAVRLLSEPREQPEQDDLAELRRDAREIKLLGFALDDGHDADLTSDDCAEIITRVRDIAARTDARLTRCPEHCAEYWANRINAEQLRVYEWQAQNLLVQRNTAPAVGELPAGTAKIGHATRGAETWTVYIHPYTDPAFVFVAALCETPEGASVDGLTKAIRRDHAMAAVSQACPVAVERWETVPDAEPWTYNVLMFSSHGEYVQQVVLGGAR
jgi:hypothetical protein